MSQLLTNDNNENPGDNTVQHTEEYNIPQQEEITTKHLITKRTIILKRFEGNIKFITKYGNNVKKEKNCKRKF